jgi:hypothetical protein
MFPVPEIHALADQDYREKIGGNNHEPEDDMYHGTLQSLSGEMLLVTFGLPVVMTSTRIFFLNRGSCLLFLHINNLLP